VRNKESLYRRADAKLRTVVDRSFAGVGGLSRRRPVLVDVRLVNAPGRGQRKRWRGESTLSTAIRLLCLTSS